MNRKSTLLVVVGLFIGAIVSAQDIHFTNYSYSPLYLSPAQTGGFAGSYRFGANVRQQFSSFIEEPFQTVMAYADMPIDFGFKKHHWIGAGLNIFADQAGDLNFKNTGAQLSVAYHYALDPKYKTVFTLGAQFGMTKRSIDTENYRSRETLLGGGVDPDRSLLERFNPSIGDINIGLGFKRWTSKKAYLDIGVSVFHFAQSEFSFTGSSIQNFVARRLNIHATYHMQSSKQLVLRPVVIYSRMGKFQNFIGQFNLEYALGKKSSTILKTGVGYRVGDAIQFLAGINYNGWDVGVAFDLTASTAAKFDNGYGGLEIGFKKMIIANKKPKYTPVIICPRY